MHSLVDGASLQVLLLRELGARQVKELGLRSRGHQSGHVLSCLRLQGSVNRYLSVLDGVRVQLSDKSILRASLCLRFRPDRAVSDGDGQVSRRLALVH